MEDVGNKEVVNVSGLSSYLGVSESIVRRLVKEKRIPFVKIEGRYVFFLPVIRRWLAEQCVGVGEFTESKAKDMALKIWETTKGM